MKRRVFVIFLIVILALLTGCSERNEIQYVKAEPLINEEDDAKTRVRSINELWAHTEPLVMCEKVYDLVDGDMEEYFVYEYDENNRYSTIFHYQKNEETQEMELFTREDFVYDDYFCYKNTTYVQQNGLLTKYIYDLHGNVILVDKQKSDYSDASTLTYTYRYPIDTETRQEEYCYKGEGVIFGHYTIKLFNEYGDAVYTMIQYDDSLHTENIEYSYDAEGRMVSKVETDTDHEIWGNMVSVTTTTYSYEKEKLVTKTEEREFIQGVSRKINLTKTSIYKYDKDGRLVCEERHYILREESDTHSEESESGSIVEYEYET